MPAPWVLLFLTNKAQEEVEDGRRKEGILEMAGAEMDLA